MKKDILVIRESIGRIVSMLTMQAITVTQRGTGAYVKYDAITGAIKELNVPYIPDDASDEFIAAIQGFLDHEVGHVLYSDPKALKEAHKLGKRVANLANIIEDVFVERKMTESFRGSGHNLESVRKFYLEKIARVKINAALKAGNLEEARGYATVAAFRAWGGQASAADFIKEPQIAALVAPVAAKLGEELMGRLAGCNSSMDCLALASEVKRRLEEKEPVEPPAPEGKPEAPEGGADSEAEGGWTPPDDEGSVKSESDDSEKTGSDKSDAVEGADDAKSGDGEGEELGDKGEKDEGESTPEDDDEPAPLEDAPDEPTPEDDTDDDSDGEEGGDTDAGAGTDDGEGETTDDDSEAGATTGEGSDTGSEDSGELDDGDEAAGRSTPDSDVEDETDPLADMFDTERDFDKDMGERLSKDAAAETAASKYAIFSTEWDKTEPAPLAKSKRAVETLDASLRDKIGVMQKQLERAVSAQARKSWNPGQRRGRIAPGGLFKTAVGDDRVFRQRHETKAKNTALSLVVDCSGSMGGPRMELAGIAAYALASVLERLSIKYEVIGFTSYNNHAMTAAMTEDAKTHGKSFHGMGYARIEPLYMPVFKPFAGKLDSEAKSRLAHLTEDPDYLLQNIDGECVQLAARRLVQQSAERHIMIVLSDGEPSCRSGRGLSAHLKTTVAALTKQGVEVIGIGIQTAAVKSFYPKSVVLNDTAELPARVMAELSKLLLAP
jgi:cobalamin biosynthesis protein CobT